MARSESAYGTSGMTRDQRTDGPAENLEAARRYIQAIESGAGRRNRAVLCSGRGCGNLFPAVAPFQSKPAGAEMRAHFAAFLQFKDGKIFEQRNCFGP